MTSDTSTAMRSASNRLYSAVDRSDETYEPSPFAARRSIPSGDVSPDGTRNWPEPSLTSKVLVYGGMGIVAAAATAGAVLGIRAIVNGIAGSDEDDAVEAARQRARARRDAPRSSQFGPRSSSRHPAAVSSRVDAERREERARSERARTERMRREAERRRSSSTPRSDAGSGNVVDTVNETVESVTRGVRDVLTTVTAAIEGFRSVASQASAIMGEFNRAADQVKSMMEPVNRGQPTAGSQTRRPSRRDVVDLRDDVETAADTRSHRL